jgi:hypothetical protein
MLQAVDDHLGRIGAPNGLAVDDEGRNAKDTGGEREIPIALELGLDFRDRNPGRA